MSELVAALALGPRVKLKRRVRGDGERSICQVTEGKVP